jgi:putative oxidoreductase
MEKSADAEETTTAPTARWKTIGFRVVTIALGLWLLLAAALKFAGIEQMVQLFDAIGIGQWFRIVTGLCELVSGFLLLFPATIGVGALLGFGIMVGATIINIFILHVDFIHSSIPAIIFAIIAWTRRGQLLRTAGFGHRNS